MERKMRLSDFVKIVPPTPRNIKIGVCKYWEATIGRACGTGETEKEALGDLQRTIKHAFDGDYNPSVIVFRGLLGIAWRASDYWYWHVESLDKISDMTKIAGYCGCDSEDEALQCMRYDLAQTAWDGTEMQSPIILDPADQEQFGRWACFQKCYQELKDAGMGDSDIRNHLFQEGL